LALLARLRSPRRPPDDPEQILLLKFWGLGSIILSTPLLREIRARYPDAHIDFVTLADNAPLLHQLPEIRRVVALDISRGIPAFLRESIRVLGRIRRQRYDLLLDLEFFTSYSAIFSFLAGPDFSCGFSARGSLRGRLHDAQIPFNTQYHVVLNFLTLLGHSPFAPLPEIDPTTSVLLPHLSPDPQAWARVEDRLARHLHWRPERALIVVNPNTGELALERRWPVERVREFLRLLADSVDANIVLTGSASERDFVATLVDSPAAGARVQNLAGELELDEFIALLARADVVVSNDSGPLHLAAAVGSSTVALFGPETPVLYGPLRSCEEQRHRVHYHRLACSPCINVHNNKMLSCWFVEAACMSGISAEEVLASTRALLDRTRAPKLSIAPASALGRKP
jgi:heptosyltransferase-2